MTARLRPLTQYALVAGPLLSMLDSSIVNVAVEPISRALHASLTSVQWAVSGYLLALGAGLAATAYLARRFGTLPVYRASVVGFTAASCLCALAPSVDVLVGARVLQGLVAAPLVPLAMSMLLGGSGGSRAMSPLAGMLLFLGPAIGPTVGGALIGVGGWRSIFLINVPFGVVAAVSVRFVPASLAPGPVPGARFDLPGLVLLAAALITLLFGASEGASSGFGTVAAWFPLLAGATLACFYVLWSRRRDQPALDLSLVRQWVPALSMALCALASIVTWAALFLLPVFVQSVQGRGALAAGLAMAPQGVITGLSTALLGPRLLPRFTIRLTVLAGFAVLAGTSAGLLLVGAGTPLWAIAVILACRSVSIGLIINPLLQALTQALHPDQLGDANTLFSVWQRVAGSFGIGVITALYTTQAQQRGPVTALHQAALIIVAIAVLGAVASLALPRIRNTAVARLRPDRLWCGAVRLSSSEQDPCHPRGTRDGTRAAPRRHKLGQNVCGAVGSGWLAGALSPFSLPCHPLACWESGQKPQLLASTGDRAAKGVTGPLGCCRPGARYVANRDKVPACAAGRNNARISVRLPGPP